MEFRNLHQVEHHQLQDHQLVGVVSSNPSPCFSAGNHERATAWRSPLFLLNNGNIHASNCDEASPNPMVQELSFINWPNPTINQSDSHLISNKIKQESSTMLSDMLNPSTSPSEMLQPKTLSPTNYKNHMINNNGELQSSAFQPSMQIDPNNYDHHDHNLPSLGGNKGMTTFSQIFPSVNISNLRNNNNNNNNDSMSSFSSSSSTMEMNNFQGGSDLFATVRLLGGGSLSQPAPSSHLIELIKGSSPFGNIDHDHMQQFSFYNNNGVPESKRSPTCIVESNSTHLTAPKRPRFESRSSCPPLKVRKEKLGDRIAALQQLVAPFGKTDTASVLMEAIGYIKFLQNQVETLSVPYMKLSSRNKSTNNSHTVSDEHCDNGELKSDLRSRGLCLVPVSCMSYLASDTGIGGVWPPSSYNPSF